MSALRNIETDAVQGVGSISKMRGLWRFAAYLVDADGNEYTEIIFANRKGYALERQREFAQRIVA